MVSRRIRDAACTWLAMGLACCSGGENSQKSVANGVNQELAPPAVTNPPVIGRRELLTAANLVTDAYFTGSAYPEVAQATAERRFRLKLPFGCLGPDKNAKLGYTYDAENQTLKISAEPEEWLSQPWAAELVGSTQSEAIEGFWIRRPWMSGEDCPGGPVGSGPSPKSPETLGLAQVFEAGESRLSRRMGRPYEVTRRVDSKSEPGPQGYRLILEGRVVTAEESRPILCSAESADSRPVCLVRVEIDRVAFETPAGAMLAEWRA